MKRIFSFYRLSDVSMSQYQDAKTIQQNGLPWVRRMGMVESWRLNLLFIEQDGFFFFSFFFYSERSQIAKPALLLTQSCRRL